MQDVKFTTGDALLIVDVQNDFLMGGALAVPEGEQVIPVINTLIAQARLRQVPIFASRDWHPTDHCSFVAQGGPWPVHCVADTEGAAYHPFVNLPDDCVHLLKATDKTHDVYSAAKGHDQAEHTLVELLRAQDIKRVWVTGLALDYCVKASALDLAEAGFDTAVILPATRAVAPQTGAAAEQALAAAGVHLVAEV